MSISQNVPKINYQRELEKILAVLEKRDRVPSLLLHSCCAPCSSSVIEYLSSFFAVTVFYYNPNITQETEYRKRAAEQKRLIEELPTKHPVLFLEGEYCPQDFFRAVTGHEEDPEGEARCSICFRMRLEKTADLAAAGQFDYYTTTLTVSPLKDAQRINRIGQKTQREIEDVSLYLPGDFKKKNGYKRSIELSKEYGLYRQDYCGCVFSKRQRQEKVESRIAQK